MLRARASAQQPKHHQQLGLEAWSENRISAHPGWLPQTLRFNETPRCPCAQPWHRVRVYGKDLCCSPDSESPTLAIVLGALHP